MPKEATILPRGDYHTRGGDAVRAVMAECKGQHLTAEDVYLSLRERGCATGLTTVYRQLEKLVAEGAVRKITGERGSCYVAMGDECPLHYHMICTVCGSLIHLDCEQIEELFRHVTESHGFVVDPSRTTLYGTCRTCVRKRKQKETSDAGNFANNT